MLYSVLRCVKLSWGVEGANLWGPKVQLDTLGCVNMHLGVSLCVPEGLGYPEMRCG